MRRSLVVCVMYLCGLLLVSIAPSGWLPRIHAQQADLLHAPAYGILTLFLTVTLRARGFGRSQAVLFAIACAVIYGGVLEISQAAVPGRAPSLSDSLMNMAGALVVCGGYLLAPPCRADKPKTKKRGHALGASPPCRFGNTARY